MQGTSERWAEGPSIVASIWRYRWLVLVVTILGGLGGLALAQTQPSVYAASTQLHLTEPGSAGVFDMRPEAPALERYLPQQAERATSTAVLETAAQTLEPAPSPGELDDQLEVESDVDLATLTITAYDGSPERAAAIANAVADAYEQEVQAAQSARVERALEELDRAAADLEAQIEELGQQAEDTAAEAAPGEAPAAEAEPPQVAALTQRLVEIDLLGQQLVVDARLFGTGVDFVEAAEPPGAPIAPQPRLSSAAGALLAALLASALAYWLAGRSRRVLDSQVPSDVLGVPLLGTLPTYTPAEAGPLAQRTSLDPRTTEAYRFVQSSLEPIMRELGASSVMITAGGPATGKTETALQLAAISSRRGRDVLLVDADLRMRGLTSFLRAHRAPGLLDLAQAMGDVRPEALVLRYPLDRRRNLDVLTAGRVRSDDDEQVSETWFGPALEAASEGYELTIVDSPPLLAVADTATIASNCDAIVLVVREGSDIRDLERVRERLRFVRQRLVGYVYLSRSALENTDFDYGLVRSRNWQNNEDVLPGRPAGNGSATTPAGSTQQRATTTRPGDSRAEGHTFPSAGPPALRDGGSR